MKRDWRGITDEVRHRMSYEISERAQEELNLNKANVPQTVGRLGRNVFGTDLIGIQSQHSQTGEVCHVDGIAETAQAEL